MRINLNQTFRVPAILAAATFVWIFSGITLAAGAPEIDSARGLLDRLERADENVEEITARVQYDRRFRLQGDRHRRVGDLYFEVEEGERRRRSFAIDFDTLIVGERMEDEAETWIFDGEWLVEKKPLEKQFIKRRIAPPDADFDPLAIGEGPMPIPIGQKAEDILERYDAELRPADDLFKGEEAAGIRQFVADTVQLRLTPKERYAEDEDLKEIRLWYRWHEDVDRFLPRMARTVNRAGDESYVQLIQVKVRERGASGPALITRDVFDVSAPAPGAGWQAEVIDELCGARTDASESAKE